MSIRSRRQTMLQKPETLVVQPLLYHRDTMTQARIKSSSGETYHVAIPHHIHPKTLANGQIYYEYTCACRNVRDFSFCKGNSRHTICKHSIKMLDDRLDRNGIGLAVCDKSENGSALENALRRLRLGGVLIRLVSTQGNGEVWAVAKRKEQVKEIEVKKSLDLRMRQQEGEYID